MADVKISALTAATAAAGANELEINEAGTSKKVTVDQIGSYLFVANAYAPGSFTLPTGFYASMVNHLILTTTQRVILQGTSRLRID